MLFRRLLRPLADFLAQHSRMTWVFILIYMVCPLDVIPDWLGPAGWLDDLVVLLIPLLLRNRHQPPPDSHG